ncbi:hypothetical protein M2360_004883 [Rhizobium sp. SG_E_25_P2]|uniref:hypothetical protein n=1 Tax=Rhizobium sp. SG_E_25_P2 TaxID=2879942 RepID=UPI0024769641|nr:hypothetical protein [Rhizobium sp. SG_E_25_P2]MDH6269455.1 hypothetical protein [Rhizobium sp. SG_E_25_P2]
MKTPIKKFRANMMTKLGSGFTRRDKKKIEYLTDAHHEQRRVVMDALPAKHFLRDQMTECGKRDDWNNIIYCRVPLCPRCHMRERTVQSAIAIKREFVGAVNEEMSFATILLPVQLDFSGMTELSEIEKRRLRTLIDRRRKKDSRWDDFQLMGWWEIDRMSFSDYQVAGRNTRLALDDLGFPVTASLNTTIWRPHLHAIVRLGRLTADEVTQALRKETHTGSYQVDLQRFRTNRDVAENLKNVIRYSLKFRIERDYKRVDAQDFIEAEDAEDKARPRAWWPAADIAAYVDWLCPTGRSGFQSLRVIIGSKEADEADSYAAAVQVENDRNGLTPGAAIIDRVRNRHKEKDKPLEADGISCLSISLDLKAIEMTGNELVLVEDHDALGLCMYNKSIHDTNWTGQMPTDTTSVRSAPSASAPNSRSAGGVVAVQQDANRRG